IRCSADFDEVVRRGVRVGTRSLVLHLSTGRSVDRSRVGFVVSKAVGIAATRNLVKRRLRAIMAQKLQRFHEPTDVVVRALPAASKSSFANLERDIEAALTKYAAKRRTREQTG